MIINMSYAVNTTQRETTHKYHIRSVTIVRSLGWTSTLCSLEPIKRTIDEQQWAFYLLQLFMWKITMIHAITCI